MLESGVRKTTKYIINNIDDIIKNMYKRYYYNRT